MDIDKNSCFKAFSCILLVLSMLLIPSISALEIDNIQTYDPVTRIYIIENWFGFGETLAEIRLNTNLNVILPRGYRQVAEFDLYNYKKDYNNAFKDMNFYQANNLNEKIERNFDYKYLDYKWEEKIIYETICTTKFNQTNQTEYQDCKQEEVDKENVLVPVWIKFSDINELPPNKDRVTIGIFTEVLKGDYVEWIPTFFGEKLTEWASWTEDLNVGLTSYYKLDESSGNLIDSVGSLDMVTNAVTYSSTGKINTAILFDSSTDWADSTGPTGSQSGSISFWYKRTDTNSFGRPFTFNEDTYNDNGYGGILIYDTGVIEWLIRGSTVERLSPQNTWDDTDWHHLVVTSNGSTTHLYLDGNDEILDEIYGSNTGQWNADISGYNHISVGAMTRSTQIFDQFEGTIDEIGIWYRDLSSDEILDLSTGISYINITDNPPNITLNSPPSTNYSSPQNLEINFTAWDDINLEDVKLYVNGGLNQTNATGINNTNYIFDLSLGDGNYIIYGRATDNKSQETNTSSITIIIDGTSPIITSASNLTDLIIFDLQTNSSWYYNVTDSHIDECYYNSTANATQTIVTCNSTITTTWTTGGNQTITYCANDTFGNEVCNTDYIWVWYIQETQADNPDPIAEGFDATFNLTINLTNIPTTTATLVLNNTIYSPTTTTAETNEYYFEVIIEIPNGWGNTTGIVQDWFWNYTINGITTDKITDTENITVYELAIDNCSTYGEIILDFYLKDEETTTAINESNGTNVEINLLLTSKTNSSIYLTYNNTWVNENNPQVCIPTSVLNNSQFWIYFTIGFDSTHHVWEFYYLEDGTLNSTKIFDTQTDYTIDLFDLLTVDSTSFLFNYFDKDGLPVDEAIIHVMRKYIGEGTFREVERAREDQNGDTIVHLVEEDVIYYFIITQNGEVLHTSSTYTALCQQTPCTIQIEASGGSATFPTDWDLMDGGAYAITSSASTRNVTLTYTNNISTDMNFTVYNYESDGSYSVISTGADTGISGVITLNVPQVAGNVSFFATVIQDDDFVNSEWVDFEEDARDRFGVTLAVFLAVLIILSLGLFAISEGVGTIVYVILGVIISGALGLIVTDLSTGVNVVIYLVLAGGILLWKLTGGRR